MSNLFFANPFPSEDPNFSGIDRAEVIQLIVGYVNEILRNRQSDCEDKRGDLYVGGAGIAFMFLQMHLKSPELRGKYPCLDHANQYIITAKDNARYYSKRADERCAFLLG